MQPIQTITEALVLQVKMLRALITEVRSSFQECSESITSAPIKKMLTDYSETTRDKELKLERMANYLMVDLDTARNEVASSMVKHTKSVLAASPAGAIRDMLLLSCLQTINAHAIALARMANLFAIELELDTVADQASAILQWELEASRQLSQLMAKEFNALKGEQQHKIN